MKRNYEQQPLLSHLGCIGCNIRVPELIDLGEGERGEDIHERGVELEVLRRGADVVGGREEGFEYHCESDGVVEAKVLGDAEGEGLAAGELLLVEVSGRKISEDVTHHRILEIILAKSFLQNII